MTGLVVGTAGHIDHGKTSLVYALTGIDTDRLKEEKQRGISIDLGFAQMALPGGRIVSFVDVPGHERFVRNMLAGAAGMEAVLLIVAATEGVMPQTREHFQICQLLGLRHGLVVLTKSDIATPEQLVRARAGVTNLIAGTFLENCPVVEVSALTGAGLADLKDHLAKITNQSSGRDHDAILRMPIDRSFTLKGFGTVVTGTILAGRISVGSTVEILPQKIKARVRGLQSQHAPVQEAAAGQRVAVNLAGIEQGLLERGPVLTTPDMLATSRMLDVELNWLDDDVPGPRELLTLHIGTAEIGVKISPLNAQFARLRTKSDVVALPGDRFVVRRPSPAQTMGGGVVVDAFPPRTLNRARTASRLGKLRGADARGQLELLINEAPRGRSREELTRLIGRVPEFLVTDAWIAARRQQLVNWLREFHRANPNAAGAPIVAARMGLEAGLSQMVMQGFGEIRVTGELVALANHRAAYSAADAAAMAKMEQAFRAGGFQPPGQSEVAAASGLDIKKARAILEALVKAGRLVRISEDLIFHAEVISHVRNSLSKEKGRRFSVVEFKSWTGISRKFAIPLLEYLDRVRVTRREGEGRLVL